MQEQPPYSDRLAAFVSRAPRLLIDGRWVSSTGGGALPVVDPSTRREIGSIAEAGLEDVDLAVAAARRSFDDGRWRSLPPSRRERLMQRLADLVEANVAELSELEAVDNGKPRRFAEMIDVSGAVAKLRYMAGWAGKVAGVALDPFAPPSGAFHAYTRREPIGVAALIVPWNFPLDTATQKLAAALAAGCSVVLKPAEQTSLSALRLGELICEAGFPDGVVNIVTGLGETVGDALVSHGGVDKVSFTGSPDVGRIIGRRAADTLKRVTLELGGKSPFIVFPDAERERLPDGIAIGVFFNSGQTCTAGTRVFAHRSIYDGVLETIVSVGGGLKVGPSLAEDTFIGPLVSGEQQERVLNFLESARAEGASIVSGGGGEGAGFYVEPTVIADVRPDMRVMREEIFGPVVCATRFDDLDDVVAQANATDYDLAASIWTRDVSTMHRLASRIRAGTVWGNCHNVIDTALPFGGFHHSGTGRESGLDGLLGFTETKTVMVSL